MQLLSFSFLIFCAAVVVAVYMVPRRLRWAVLLVAGLALYGVLEPKLWPCLAAPTLLVYFLAPVMERTRIRSRKRVWLAMILVSGLAPLLAFKYAGFLTANLGALLGREIALSASWVGPMGISFYSFRLISYGIDVYRNQIPAERHPGFFGLYVSFFPQLAAGPIERAGHLLPQIRKMVRIDSTMLSSGLQLVVWGLFKKMVIADRMALFVNPVFQDPAGHAGLPLLFGMYFYALQIYCDFSGYTDIAIGLARILGFRSVENFRYPYLSRSLSEFWTRWHISLSTWLRDYLFLPASYAVLRRVRRERISGIRTESWAYVAGILITMILGGLWHGAAWTFVMWGALHGFYLACGHAWKRAGRRLRRRGGALRLPRGPDWLRRLWCFHLVALGWIVFRSPSFRQALAYISGLGLRLPAEGRVHLAVTLLFAGIFVFLELIWRKLERREKPLPWPVPVKAAAAALFVCFLILFAVDQGNEFIYFQF